MCYTIYKPEIIIIIINVDGVAVVEASDGCLHLYINTSSRNLTVKNTNFSLK